MIRTTFIVFIVVMTCGYSIAADTDLVYAQKTGKLTLAGKEIGKGYSGAGIGKNNPDKEKEKEIGPIPAGEYKVSKPRKYKGMPNCFDLTPSGHTAHGRTELMIHGDSKANPGTASKGCIILDKNVRKAIADGKASTLKVVKE